VIAVEDGVGRRVRLAAPATRVASLVPSLTETVVALGCAKALVAATRYCSEPAQGLEHVERVGGTKNPDLKRLLALHPDLVLLDSDENRKADFDALVAAAVPVFVTAVRRLEDVPELLVRLGRLTGAAPEAARRAASLRRAMTAIRGPQPAGLRVFCPIWRNPWMSFNGDTYPGDLLAAAGSDNVCAKRAERYCTVTLEEIAATEPQVVLLPDEPYRFQRKDLDALRPLQHTPAWQSQRICFLDGKVVSWFGARTEAGLRELARALGRAL
jgi:ABC-type Fe3+-hydroxamate transport system substrate-binding protein